MKKKAYETPVTTLFHLTPHTLLAGSVNVLSSDGNSLPINTAFDEADIDEAI